MKFAELKSVAHNIADSMVSGIGLMIGVYEMDIYGEAASSPGGHITVDLLTGTAISGNPSPKLAHAIELYAEALPALCERHGFAVSEFRKLTVRFGTNRHHQQHFIVTIESQEGRTSTDTYYGSPAVKSKQLR